MYVGFRSKGTQYMECPICKKLIAISDISMTIEGDIAVQDSRDPFIFLGIDQYGIENSPDIQFDPNGWKYIRIQCKHHDKPVFMVPCKEENDEKLKLNQRMRYV